MVAIVLGSGIMVGTVIGAHKVAAPPEEPVFLEQAETPGADPFVPLAQPSPAAPGSAGSGDVGRCEPDMLVAYLAAHRTQAQAWVVALNSDPALRWSGGGSVSVEQIPAYVAELHPVILNADIRVTNHQFTRGRAVAVQSVLQRGTAVLADAAGVARVRCACGNPLAPMRKITSPPRYVGVPWSGFTPVRVEVTVVNRTDIETRDRCGRNEYFDGDRCRAVFVCPQGQYLGEDERCYFPDRCPPEFEQDEATGACTPTDRTPDCPDGASPLPDDACPTPVDCPPGETDLRCRPSPACPQGAQNVAREPCAAPSGPDCPDNILHDETSGTCPPSAPPPDCPDATDLLPDGSCPALTVTCADGSTALASDTCPDPVETCPDGSTVPAGGGCPEPVQTCADGSTTPAVAPCPEPEQTCPDGSTLPMSDPCPEPDETCPDGEPCPEPTTTASDFPLRGRAADTAVPI